MRIPSSSAGLYCTYGEDDHRTPTQLPLLKTSVTVHVKDMCSHTITEQWFVNTCSTPTKEATYCFPLDSKAAVAGFESELDGVISCAKVYEKQQAQDAFNDAVGSGGSAQLLLQETPDIFQTKIGGACVRAYPHHSLLCIRNSELVRHPAGISRLLVLLRSVASGG